MLEQYEIIIRLILSTILGGLIGIERESVRRAAGLRTHILVCSGSTLVMLLSVFIFHSYRGYTNLDPARLGAQVISGIGFLGAGTIMRDGNTIKGLTTAASLWAVATIGLALGVGFYTGAIATTIIVLVVLKIFSRLEIFVPDRRNTISLKLLINNVPGQLARVAEELGLERISIINITLDMEDMEDCRATLFLKLKVSDSQTKSDIITMLSRIEGVFQVTQL